MKSMKKILISCLMFIFIVNGIQNPMAKVQTESTYPLANDDDFETPIVLNGNSEVDQYFENQSSDGLSWDTAFKLENIKIKGSSSFQGGIYIQNSDRFVIIDNCTINFDSGVLGESGGIFLINCSNYLIQNSYSESYLNAIFVKESFNIQIKNCTVNAGREDGIHIKDSQNCLVENNTVKNNPWYGICIKFSENTIVQNNLVSNNLRMGIAIYNSEEITVKENIIRDNGYYGILLSYSNKCTITKNEYIDNGNGDYSIVAGEGNKIEQSIAGFNTIFLIGVSLLCLTGLIGRKIHHLR